MYINPCILYTVIVMQRISKQIYTKITQARHVMLVPHKNPDGDALGSVTVLIHWLRKLNIEHTAYCATDISGKHSYLPHLDKLSQNESVWNEPKFDVMIVLDSGDLKHAGVDAQIKKLSIRPFIINIDHHATNEHYGDLNLVITEASSTTEIIYKLFKHNNVLIDNHMATCLLTGILTDTDNFTNSATTMHSLQIASELIGKGGNINLIKELIFKNKSIGVLKLWGAVLSRLAKHDTHEIVYSYVTQKDLAEHKVDESDLEGITNFMNNLSEGKAALILKELPEGKVKGSFRATRDDMDVSAIAKALGGGGHKKAAGFTVSGSIDEALKKIWEVIKNLEDKN